MTTNPDEEELGDIEVEVEPDPTPELWIDAESGYLPDAPAVCAKYGIEALTMCDGGLIAYVESRGAVPFGELQKSSKTSRKSGEVRPIKTGG